MGPVVKVLERRFKEVVVAIEYLMPVCKDGGHALGHSMAADPAWKLRLEEEEQKCWTNALAAGRRIRIDMVSNKDGAVRIVPL